MSFTTKMTLIASLFQRVYDSSFVLLIFFVHGMSIFLSYLSNVWYFFSDSMWIWSQMTTHRDPVGIFLDQSGQEICKALIRENLGTRQEIVEFLKVFPGSTIAMVGSWMKCQKFVISKCLYIRRFINTSDQVISIVQARYFIFHEYRKLKCDNWIYFALLGILLSSLWAKFPFLLVILFTDFPMFSPWFSK